MSDLISREALIGVIKNVQEHMREANAKPVPVDAREIFTLFVEMVNAQPTVEAVPKSYAEQIRWERDVAVGQLNEIGCQFGQKMDEVKKKLEVLQWIPCSERMPEEPKGNPIFCYKRVELYLISVKNSDYPFRAFWNGKIFTDGFGKVDAIAWMPLPEPYKGE